jgi:rod shape-determining protein MreC
MKSLIRLLIKYHAFLLFLALEILSFVLIANNDRYYQANLVNTANRVKGNIYEVRENITGYFGLKQENQDLISQIEYLQNKPKRYYEIRMVQSRGDSVPALPPDTVLLKKEQTYRYIPARVIQNSLNTSRNYILLDKGTNDGVHTDMAVINEKGAVGIITQVSRHIKLGFDTQWQ